MLVVGVAHTEAAAEVVDLEGAERGDGFDRRRQLLDVEQLGADVGMHAVEPHLGAALDPRDRLAGVVGHQAELGSRVAGRLRGVGGGLHAGDDPHQTRLPVPRGDDALEPVDVVEVVDHDEADAVFDGKCEFVVGLGVAVQDQPGRIGACLERGQDLAAARDVDVQALFDHHPLNGGARERLRRERHIAAGPATAESGQIVAGPLPQCVFGNDDRRGTELLGHIVEAATADHECAVAVGSGARRKEADQLLGRRLGVDRHRLSLPPRARM